MHNVSEHFICIPLHFPRRPWLYRKLSQWLINCPSRSMMEPGARGRADIVSVYTGMGSILSPENSRILDAVTQKKHADTYNKGAFRVQSECCHEINNNPEMAQIFTGTQETAYLLHAYFLPLPHIVSRTLIREVKPHLWM